LFTGIVEEVGVVASLIGSRLRLRAGKVLEGMKLGDSIALNGACLTVVSRDDGEFCVELSPETLRRTSFASLMAGQGVNLERPLAVNDRLGGHIVQGHVDASVRVVSSKPEGNSIILRVSCPKRLMPYIVEKGFITVDGISLTVVKKSTSSFTLSLIPYTLAGTTLKDKAPGDRVNLETDVLAKYVESLLSR
jgi:riboflavin synthase